MADVLRVNPERLLADLDALAVIGADETGAVTRPSLSPNHAAACTWLRDSMERIDLACRIDGAGNLIGRSSGTGPALMIGSHLDTGPAGGRLDGALGLVSALEAWRRLREIGPIPTRALEVVCFLDEHGHFHDCLGSKASTGQLTQSDLVSARSPDGRHVNDAFRTAGLDPEGIMSARREPSEITAYLELHVEQGPILDSLGVPIGIVDQIAAISRQDITFRGGRNHAGQTPTTMRRDALRGAAQLVVTAFDEIQSLADPDVRLNFGAIECRPGATSTIPELARLRFEYRDPNEPRLENFLAWTGQSARLIGERFGLDLAINPVGRIGATSLDPQVSRRIAATASALNLDYRVMASGTGHDAQVMARFCPTGLIFVPSVEGRSHCAEEATPYDAIIAGANVLLGTACSFLLN